jgi:hypothetical protein
VPRIAGSRGLFALRPVVDGMDLDFVQLGDTGLQTSETQFGTWRFGKETEDGRVASSVNGAGRRTLRATTQLPSQNLIHKKLEIYILYKKFILYRSDSSCELAGMDSTRREHGRAMVGIIDEKQQVLK